MSVRQYVGARYVPLFADPITWDPTQTYEALTVVLYQGNSYTSRQAVPANIDITNQTYWAQTGNYNAQVEQYRQEVQTFDGRITQNAEDISDEETARANADTALSTAISNEATARGNADSALQTAINNEATARASADSALDGRIDDIETSLSEEKYMIVIGDSFSNDAQSGTPLWYTYVAQHYGLTVYTTASDGVGFVSGPNTFAAQFNNAVNALNGKTVDRVYILGGLNDTRSGSYDVDTCRIAARDLLSAIKNQYPNAKIAMYGPESFPDIQNNNKSLSTWLAWYCALLQIEYHDLTMAFQLYNNFFGGKTGDNPHPSADGQKIIASYVVNHGQLPSVNWIYDNLPTNMSSYSTIPLTFYTHAGSGTINNNGIIKSQNFYKVSEYEYVFVAQIDATKIPNTVTQLGIYLPYNAQRVIDVHGLATCDFYISELYGNIVSNGWVSSQPSILFNINAHGAPATGENANDIRILCRINTR